MKIYNKKTNLKKNVGKTLLPAGFSDKLFPKSQKEFIIIEKIISQFANFGYSRVNPPLVEFEDTFLSEGPGSSLKENTFRIMDPLTHKMMALRSDMTTQISRIASTRLSHHPRPLRLSYSGDVLRVKSTISNMNRQLVQVGAEIIGDINYLLEAEIMLVGLKTLSFLGIHNMTIDLNFPLLKDKLITTDNEVEEKIIQEAIQKKDIKYLKSLNFSNKNEILNLMNSYGHFESKDKYLKKLTLLNKRNKFISNLVNLANEIKNNFPEVKIILDPLESSNLKYYEGVTFTIFSNDMKLEVAKGGTYKTSTGEKATGISIYIESIGNISKLIKKKSKILLNKLNFNNAEDYIKKGYEVVFSVNANLKNYKKIANMMKCNYALINNKLYKIDE